MKTSFSSLEKGQTSYLQILHNASLISITEAFISELNRLLDNSWYISVGDYTSLISYVSNEAIRLVNRRAAKPSSRGTSGSRARQVH